MALQNKDDIIRKYQLHDTDRGSAPVQIALLTARINELTDHFPQAPEGPPQPPRAAR